MPSSSAPPEYRRAPQRFFYRGISLQPQDALPEGKVAYVHNMRSHEEGTVEPRYGQSLQSAAPAPAAIHSIFRLNDTTPFASGSSDQQRFLGSGAAIYAGPASGTAYASIDTGYSGDPLSAVDAAPFASSRPYLYIGDSVRQRKIDSSLTAYPIGLTQPVHPPSALLAAPQTTFLSTISRYSADAWTGYGSVAYAGFPPAGTPLPLVARVDTVIAQILYDTGITGMASVVPASTENIIPGTTLEISAAHETAIVQEVLPPVSPTTIAAIIYDVGTAGLCTIQPTGSFSVGQIELALPEQVRRRYNDLGQPAPPPVTLTRTVDYPVNAVVSLGGVESVRVLSIAIGPDGVQSFRCSTLGTFVAGATISGVGSFRAYCQSVTPWAAGDAIVGDGVNFTITPPNTTDTVIGGMQGPLLGFRNWALVGNRATQPEDIIRFGIRVSSLNFIKSVRLVLDLGGGATAFLQDYLFYEWRAADLVTAIQSASELVTGYVHDAQRAAVDQGQIDAMYVDQYAQGPQPGVSIPVSPNLAATRTPSPNASYTGQTALPRLAPVVSGAAISRQLALGNDTWMTLECRVGDLTRIGTDPTLTLGVMYNAAIYFQVLGTTDTITLNVCDCYLTGGYGPDVSTTLPPIVYRHSYRSTVTGERSNVSPSMRAGMFAHRGRITITAPASADPQCDVVDFWRFGGALAKWVYVGTSPNNPGTLVDVTYTDDLADRMIDGGETPRVDLYQPWPTTDLPRSGICRIAGTAIQRVSGDAFDPRWAPDSLIIVNGIATQLYQSPASATQMDVIDNCGSGANVPWSMPQPTLLAQALPGLWGGAIGNAWFHFACGDPNDPGALHWTHANNPDGVSDKFELIVTSASESLQNGWMDDGVPYVASTEDIYRIIPTPNDVSMFRTQGTNCGRGFWTRWAYCADPNGGCYFLAKDGIYRVVGGGAAVCITLPDLQPLFPQEGTVPEAIRGLNPVDMTATTALKLTLVGQYLYFDYRDTAGEYHTLVYEPLYQRWTPDTYAVGVTARCGEPGPQVLTHMMGGVDGNLRQYAATRIGDVDANIPWAIWTPWAGGDDPRSYKQWGDAILDFNPADSVDGVSVTPVVDNGNVLLAEQIVGIGGTVRDTYTIEVGAAGASTIGYGVISRNFGLQIHGNCQVCSDQRPLLYLWEAAGIVKGTGVGYRATDWDDLAYKGAKFVQGVVIRANTFGVDKLVQVQYDGPNAAPTVALTLTLNHDGEQTKTYPLAAAGWAPFIAELVRLKGDDTVEWTLLDWRFVWEPAPELATQYETQYTTFDYPGFLAVYDGVVAYQSTTPITWRIEYQDGAVETHVLASSGGAYLRTRQICAANKGKAVRFRWTADTPFRLFKRDCAVRAQAWGVPGGYQRQQPFGGPSRVDGAEL